MTRVIWLQRRPHRAGAQTCLLRLLSHPLAQSWDPIIATSKDGWLTNAARMLGVECVVTPFPSSRSLAGRLFGNQAFARRLAASVEQAQIVHANDHQEGLLGIALARRLGVRNAIFLRSSTMTREDYFKYQCDRYDYVAAIGEELASRVRGWDSNKTIDVFYDGITEAEFAEPKLRPPQPPDRILVIGSELASKGWRDLVDAALVLEDRTNRPSLQFDFTGERPERSRNDLGLERLKHTHCQFLGRTEHFSELVARYDLVINPSRSETFGIAAIEVLAAGIPLLSSRTGIIQQVLDQQMLFEPSDPADLARILDSAIDRWPQVDFGVANAQENIRENFLIDRATEKLDRAYRALI